MEKRAKEEAKQTKQTKQTKTNKTNKTKQNNEEVVFKHAINVEDVIAKRVHREKVRPPIMRHLASPLNLSAALLKR